MSSIKSKFINLYGQPHPPSAGEALEHSVRRYASKLESCSRCATSSPIRYVEDGSCYGCAVREIKETLFNLRNDPNGEDHKVPTSPGEALEYGFDYWFTGKACDKGPHPEKRDVNSSKCLTCNEANPRQEAIKRGAKTYVPTLPCKACHRRAEKRVDNGKCSGCNPSQRKRHGPSAELMAGCPAIVLGKAEAIALGFKVFRTGEACARGHKAFRYTSTGGCLRCKGES